MVQVFPSRLTLILGVIGFAGFAGLAILLPYAWYWVGGYVAALSLILLIDAAVTRAGRLIELETVPPALLFVGSSDELPLSFRFLRSANAGPVAVRLNLGVWLQPVETTQTSIGDNGRYSVAFDLLADRRGVTSIDAVWLKWSGRLGFIAKQKRFPLALEIPVTPNTKWVKQEAVRLLSRTSNFGVKTQLNRGEGTEFDALVEYATGMDRRSIDWKASAKHAHLLAKEFRDERNHNIVLAFDTGRLMSDPIEAVTRLDRAVNAGLLLAYASLHGGDRVSLYGFDARPNLSTGFVQGSSSFGALQAQATQLRYATVDANYALGLAHLSGKLKRRSLIVIFTEFVDTTSAELMIETAGRLARTHLVLFAVFRDVDMEALIDAVPETLDDLTMAVVADGLLDERQLVLSRLRRLGIEVMETSASEFGSELVSRYLAIRKENRI